MKKRILEQNKYCTIVETEVHGETVHIRYTSDGFTDIRLTDAFCRTIGYKDKDAFLRDNPVSTKEAIRLMGHVPEWVTMLSNGHFGLCIEIESDRKDLN